MDTKISRARAFADKAHANQCRKFTDEPYISHPAAVAQLVLSVPHTTAMVAAAWLHDVVEDTSICLAEIEAEFGAEVASLVEQLTDVSRPEDGNRAARKAVDRDHTAQSSPEAQTIKLADIIDNTRSVVERDPVFAKTYLKEKALSIEVLSAGDPFLRAMAATLI